MTLFELKYHDKENEKDKSEISCTKLAPLKG